MTFEMKQNPASEFQVSTTLIQGKFLTLKGHCCLTLIQLRLLFVSSYVSLSYIKTN